MKDKEENRARGEYLTVNEAMRELKVCRNTLRKYVQAGEIRIYRIGRLVRIRAIDLQHFIEDRLVRLEK